MGLDEATRHTAPPEDRRESSVLTDKVHSGHVTQGIEIERFEKEPQNGALIRKRQDSFSQRPFLSTLELLASRQAIDRPTASNANLALEVSKAGMTDLNRPLSRMDIFYGGSTMSLATRLAKRPQTTTRRSEVAQTVDFETAPKPTARSTLFLSSAGLQDLGETSHSRTAPKWTHGILASLRSMLDLSLLQSPTFMILAFSGFLTLFCFFVPFAFIGALADERMNRNQNNSSIMDDGGTISVPVDNQHSKGNNSSQILLVLLGLFNVLGRVLCGYISDHPKVDPLVVSSLALIIGGIATAIAPLLDQLWMFAFYCLPFAFGAASFAALRSVICVELLGIERLTSAFGMLMLFMGVAALLGPPFARLLKDFTGSYGLSFHIMGIVMAASGALCIPLRRINNWENANRKSPQQRSEQKDVSQAKATELQPFDK